MHNILIDSEFQALIPPLSAEERAQLEANLLADGCRDPLVVWPLPTHTVDYSEAQDGSDVETYVWADAEIQSAWHEKHGEETWRQWPTNEGKYGDYLGEEDWPCILIDGHNRYEICTRLGLPFEVVTQELDSRDAVMDWMDANQLGRRNITPDQFTLLLGRRYNRAKKAHGGDRKTGESRDQIEPLKTADKLATEHGVSPATVKRAGQYAEAVAAVEKAVPGFSQAIAAPRQAVIKAAAIIEKSPEKAAEILSGNKSLVEIQRAEKEEKREERREENRAKVAEVVAPEQIIEAGARFATITIDPPWDWGDEGDQDQLGRARPDYSTMSFSQLLDLPVGELADDDCHIYMWITNRSLPKGFQLLEKWGFRYVTALTWVKPHFGMGNYFRGQTEHVLFGVKGSQMLKRKDVGTVFHAPRGPNGHSSKPVEFYELVESCSPGPYLEMFSRSQRADWTTWGENANACA